MNQTAKEKTKEEVIQEYLDEVKKDLQEIEFGRVIIYVDNGYPYRMETQKSKKPDQSPEAEQKQGG